MKVCRKLLHRTIEIEPLSEARWARVERAVLDAGIAEETAAAPRTSRSVRDAAPVRWRFAVLCVMTGALATISGAAAWRFLLPDGHAGATRVETAANGSRVEFGESTIDVGPASAVRLTGDDSRGVVVTLDRGRVECDVTPRRGRPPFVVDAGGVEVRVIGTHFVVERTADTVAVDVQRGQVDVTSGGERSLVSAGSHWPRSTEAAPGAEDTAAPEASSAPAEARGGSSSAPRSAGSTSPRDQYDTASRLEARQPEAALAMYRDLARQGGAWGRNALFAEGRLQADRGDKEDARHLLRDYLARYPSGPNAEDARRLIDRLR
jgi:ferric-dicitrate binding protein FerR (iron transport regulator)